MMHFSQLVSAKWHRTIEGDFYRLGESGHQTKSQTSVREFTLRDMDKTRYRNIRSMVIGYVVERAVKEGIRTEGT